MKSLTANQTKLGFIGLGNMGSLIAQRLLDHEYPLSVYDLGIPRRQKPSLHNGGSVAKSISGTGEHGRCGSILPDQR